MLSSIWFERNIYFDKWTKTFLCVEWLMIELLKHRFLKLCMKNLIIKKKKFIRKSRQNIFDSKSCEMLRIIGKPVIYVNEKLFRKKKEVLHFIWINILWQKVCVDIVHMQSFKKKHYLIFVRKNFSKWIENKIFVKTDFEFVARFIYENIICRHECFERLMIDDDSKNKKLIKTFIQKYRIKRLIISVFHSQINEMIERKHISIKNALSKLTFEKEKKWIRHFHSVLWADRTIIKRFTDMTSLRIIIKTETVLSIELNVLIWQILFWKEVHTIVDFLILRAKQIQRKNENLKETIMHLQKVKTKVKNLFNENYRIRTKDFRKIDMIMLYDIRLNNQHFERLTFR